MAEENAQTSAENAQDVAPSFQLVRCYLKDASLEMPHAPDIFLEPSAEAPKVDLQFEVMQQQLKVEDGYEVVVRGTVTVSVADKTMFLVEGKQAGIFEIKNVPAEALQHLVNVVCPSIVYPYLRANLSDLTNRTGLPAVMLPEVNFEGLYQQRLAQAQAEAAAAEQAAHA